MSKGTIQYTIRGIPEEVDRVLRERAKGAGVSLNQLVLEELAKVTVGTTKKGDFSEFVGAMHIDEEFQAILDEQRKIDWEMWK
jgi:hypothetical protein